VYDRKEILNSRGGSCGGGGDGGFDGNGSKTKRVVT